jgi:MerR family transcriptional regulator, light-induced transcriptional regulator
MRIIGQAMYTIKQAAARSGINVPLLRAWERRYAIVAPTRTDAGYRLYDEAAIVRLRAMRSLVDAGWSPRQAAQRVVEAGDAAVADLASEAPAGSGDDSPTAAEFVDAASRLDAGGIERALDDMFAVGSFERVVEDRLFPALEALGDAWAHGHVSVAGEHAASAAAIRRLGIAFEAAAHSGTGEPPVIVGLPPGMRHEAAALAFGTAARRAGLPVIYLGGDVPADSWVAATETSKARAAVMGVVMDRDVAAADEVVAALRAARPALTVAVGGRRAAEVADGEILHLPPGLSAAVDELRRALGRAGPVGT